MSQDARVEAKIEEGLTKLLEAVEDVLPIEAASVVRGFRAQALRAGRGAIIDLLDFFGVDTSAHVTAPDVDVHVHRPPKP